MSETLANSMPAGMPAPGICWLCHEEGDESVPPEQRPESFFVGDEYAAQRLSALDEEVIFSHLLHVEAGAACESFSASRPKRQ